jgi:hypothetical protein
MQFFICASKAVPLTLHTNNLLDIYQLLQQVPFITYISSLNDGVGFVKFSNP